jgi:CDP-diacylglycerol pyrophosphatase
MLPLRVQTKETLRGHLMITCVTTVVLKKIQDVLKTIYTSLTPLFLNLRNHKCTVYHDKVITQEAFKKANDSYKLFGIKCRVTIPHKSLCG